MRNRKTAALLACVFALSLSMSACGLIGKDEPEEQVIVEETPTPAPTETPEPTKEPVDPEPASTHFVSADGTISMELPDTTWVNKTDMGGMVSFESEGSGKILIIHGNEEDLASALVPESEDFAIAFENSASQDMENGVDYTVRNYINQDQNGVNLISYTVDYNDLQKSDGIARKYVRFYMTAAEFYSISATLNTSDEAVCQGVVDSINSFTLLGESVMKGAVDTAGTASAEQQGGQIGGQTSDGYTEEQLADTSQTRAIYTNDGSGIGFVITAQGDGTWTDGNGNTFTFETENDVYDQNGTDYYYHGEPGNVIFMSVNE